MVPLRILWSHDDLLAVWKPSGIPVQPDPTGDVDLISLLQAQFNGQRFLVTHRLDRPVSGVVLVARSSQAAEHINEQFRQRSVRKVYWAIVEGEVAAPITLEGSIQRDGRARKARVVRTDGAMVKARLSVEPIAKGDRYTLVDVVPEGGAFHQIRAQLGAAGWPIKGDVKYGARRGEKDRSIALHARSIAFRTPSTGEDVVVDAPAPGTSLWNAMLALVTDQG
jgi:23S rRNA pseudouridine1911/1915/1917 synthase